MGVIQQDVNPERFNFHLERSKNDATVNGSNSLL